jgi:CYTH domain-containing protein
MTKDKAVPFVHAGTTHDARTTLSAWPPSDYFPQTVGVSPRILEIERKFLVLNDAWKHHTLKSEHLRDGLIARFGEGKVRIRLTDSSATLTIKGPRNGIVRQEFEYEIPRAHAEQMLQTICKRDPILEKVRHTVPFGGLNWQVDVYLGPLAGIVFAEVELEHPDQEVQLPPWVGEEVTHDPRFRKHALIPVSRGLIKD